MNLKTFRVENMAEAMQVIKKEIGPDAVILSSRQVRKKSGLMGVFSKKEIEVIAGYDEEPDRPMSFRSMVTHSVAESSVKKPPAAIRPVEDTSVQDSIDELKSMIEALAQQVNSPAQELPADKRYSPDVMELYRQLREKEIDEETADEICAKTQEVCAVKHTSAQEVAESMMLDILGTPHPIEATKYKQKVVMIIGPTGVGKTTTLAKLAYTLVYKKKLNIGVINTDSFRVAAQEHLKAYCEILKADMITIYKPEEIQDALAAFSDKDIVLVDTAGKVSDDQAYRLDIARLVSQGKINDIYVTLSASTADRVLKKTLDNYAFLKKFDIIVTKVDEVSSKGVLVSISKHCGMPISYLASGQNVPDDIGIAQPGEIVKSILEN